MASETKMDVKVGELSEELRKELGAIELAVNEYTLADAIREGSRVTEQAVGNYGDGFTACAMTAALVAAKARGYVA